MLRMYCNRGKVRAVLDDGRKERKIGRVPSSVFGGEALPKSNSSQTQVTASPFGSVTLALSVKGVFAGIVKLLNVAMLGALLPVAAVEAQVPEPAA